MPHNFGLARNETALIPETLDDFVPAESPIRILDSVIESLNLNELGFKHAVAADTGRPPFYPGDLLRLYVYGYLNGINSSRDLAKQCKINMELMWLIKRITPDFRTISEFRKNNREPIERAMRKVNEFWMKLGLFGGELVGIDSSKFKAVNSKDNNYSEQKLEHHLEHYRKKISAYMERLQQSDQQEIGTTGEVKLTKDQIEEIEKKLEEFKHKEKEHSERLVKLRESGEKQISTIDPESRRMKSGDGTIVGYSAQMSIDSKYNMILDFDITNAGNDTQQLEHMATGAKEILKVETLKVATDTGYYKSEEIIKCEKAGIEVYISAPRPPIKNDALFEKADFQYDSEKDVYTCPAQQQLIFKGIIREHGRDLRRYEPKEPNTCQNCPLQSQCTTRKTRNRRITRFIDEEILEKALQRSRANPGIRTLRKSMVEHPFGTIKCRINHGRFLTKGIKVRAEFALTVIAYNFKRAISLLGDNPLISPFFRHPIRQNMLLSSV